MDQDYSTTKTDEELFEMFDSFQEESQTESSYELFKDLDIDLDPDMERLVIRCERIAGIQSI